MTLRATTAEAKQRSTQSGFSLVELMVSISVIIILSITLVVQQSQFDSSIYLKNLAYEVSLAVREAQVYAGRGENISGGPQCNSGGFDCPYGVYFDKDGEEDDPSMVLFRDIDDDGSFDSDESIEEYVFGRSNSIARLCDQASGSCSDEGDLHITFDRLSPTPHVRSGGPGARVVLENIDGTEVAVRILASGQIAVEE